MIFRFAMYYLSFLPLWISIVFIDVLNCFREDHNLWTEKISIVLICVGLIVSSIIVWKWIRKDGKQNKEKYIVESVKEERFGAAEFLLSIVIPLFAFDFTKWNGAVLFIFFFFIFCFLTIRHNYFSTNLVLELFGYCVYECQLKNGRQCIEKRIVSKSEFAKGDTIQTKKFNNEYHFAIKILKDGEEQ